MTDEVTTANPEEIRRSLDENKTDVGQPAPAPVAPVPAPVAPPTVDRSQMSNEWRARNPA